MTETQATPPPWAGGPGGPGSSEPITETPYLTVGGDSLPSIAERCGHSGEWLALFDANPDNEWVQQHWNNIQPGLLIDIPPEWLGPTTKPAEEDTTTRTKRGSSSDMEKLEKAAEDFERRHSRG